MKKIQIQLHESTSKGAPSSRYKPAKYKPTDGPKNPERKLGEKEFLKLTQAQKLRYLKAFPNSSHRFLMKDAPEKNKHFAIKKKAFNKPKQDVVVHDNKLPATIKIKQQARDKDQAAAEEQEYKKDFKNFINRESVGAIQKLSPKDLMVAGNTIRNNVPQISTAVYDAFENKRGIFETGLSSVQKIFNGEKIDPKERKSATQVMATVAKYAMLAAGIAVLATASAPAAFIVARMMHESWGSLDEASGDKAIRDKKRADKEAAKEEIRRLEEEARTPEERYEEEKARIAKLLNSGKLSQRAFEKAMEKVEDDFAADKENYEDNKRMRERGEIPKRKRKKKVEDYVEAATLYEAIDDPVSVTLNNLIVGVGDFITHMDLDELKERAGGTFKGMASNNSYMSAIVRNVCIQHDCYLPIQDIGIGLHGTCHSNDINKWLSDLRGVFNAHGYTFIEPDATTCTINKGSLYKSYRSELNETVSFTFNRQSRLFAITYN